jgi:hypothetical protein
MIKDFGMKMNRMNKTVSMVIIVSICLLFIYGGRIHENIQPVFSEKRFILIVDLSVLNCPLCVQSFTEFIGVVNAFKLENDVLGVLVFSRRENGSNPETQMKIAEKKLRGFVIGNDVQFPFFLDRSGVFKALNPDAAAILILFDREESEIKKFTFPLTSAQIEELYRE